MIVPPPLVHFLPTPFRLVDFPHTATFGDVAAVAFAADRSRRPRVRLSDDTGAATAEYAIVIMAAVSFAGLLVTIMRSGEVRSILTDLVQQALTVG